MSQPESHRPLSSREAEVVDLAANGLTDAAIAHRLGISEATVATYWGRVRMKYGPLPRAELVSHVLQESYDKELESLREENQFLIRQLGETLGSEDNPFSQGIFQEALNASPDCYFVVSRDGTIEWANDATRSLLGYEPGELVGTHIAQAVPDHFRKIHKQHLEQFFDSPERRVMAEHSTVFAKRKDDELVEICVFLSGLATKQGEFAVCIARPCGSAESNELSCC